MAIQQGPAPVRVKTKRRIFIAREVIEPGHLVEVSAQIAAELVAADKAERCNAAVPDADDAGKPAGDDLLAGQAARRKGRGDA